MSVFEALYTELDEWNFDGDEAMLWWRDDDAVADSAALAQLLSLSKRYHLPVALAVIPHLLEDSLVVRLQQHPKVHVLQHGVRHQSHAPGSDKNQELSRHADPVLLRQEIAQGLEVLSNHFQEQFIPVMVPPWNRIDDAVTSWLADLGYLGLSCFLPRQRAEVAENVWLVNTHIDVINWKQDRSFAGAEPVLAQLVDHLKAKRTGMADRAEPTGLMTHHLVHDQACWEFLDALFAVLDDHPAVTWLSAERAFQSKWRRESSEGGNRGDHDDLSGFNSPIGHG